MLMVLSGDGEASSFTRRVCLFTHREGNGEGRDKHKNKCMLAKFPMMPIALIQALSL